jgi:hypothetical protein
MNLGGFFIFFNLFQLCYLGAAILLFISLVLFISIIIILISYVVIMRKLRINEEKLRKYCNFLTWRPSPFDKLSTPYLAFIRHNLEVVIILNVIFFFL